MESLRPTVYSADTYEQFANEYQFQHFTSSPYYPHSNGEAERAVGTIKRLLNKEKPCYPILQVHSTTEWLHPVRAVDESKAEDNCPYCSRAVKAKSSRSREEEIKRNQKSNFDSRRGVRDLPELEEGELVWIPDHQTEAVVQEEVAP